jgi:hypothetical protein
VRVLPDRARRDKHPERSARFRIGQGTSGRARPQGRRLVCHQTTARTADRDARPDRFSAARPTAPGLYTRIRDPPEAGLAERRAESRVTDASSSPAGVGPAALNDRTNALASVCWGCLRCRIAPKAQPARRLAPSLPSSASGNPDAYGLRSCGCCFAARAAAQQAVVEPMPMCDRSRLESARATGLAGSSGRALSGEAIVRCRRAGRSVSVASDSDARRRLRPIRTIAPPPSESRGTGRPASESNRVGPAESSSRLTLCASVRTFRHGWSQG